MGRTKEKLLEEHKKLKELPKEELKKFLTEHFRKEEEFFRKHLERLGGEDDLSPLGMVRKEHQLLLELLERGDFEGFEELLKYHLEKEERQIFTLLD